MTTKDQALERAKALDGLEPGWVRDAHRLAIDYWGYRCTDLGPGRRTRLLAFAHYAQAVEGLRCEDPLYRLDSAGAEWFKANGGAR